MGKSIITATSTFRALRLGLCRNTAHRQNDMLDVLLDVLGKCHNERGMCYGQLGRHEEACADYDEAVALDPAEAVYFYNRGNAHSALGALPEAAADFQRVRRRRPSPLPGIAGVMCPSI